MSRVLLDGWHWTISESKFLILFLDIRRRKFLNYIGSGSFFKFQNFINPVIFRESIVGKYPIPTTNNRSFSSKHNLEKYSKF